MNPTNRRRPAILLVALALSPGCALAGIHGELVQANRSLDQANHRLERMEGHLGETKELMVELRSQLEVMSSVDETLQDLDLRLEALSGTFERMEAMIPLLSLALRGLPREGAAGGKGGGGESEAAGSTKD